MMLVTVLVEGGKAGFMARVHTGESALARAVRIVESFGVGDSAVRTAGH
ncbi:hypothetical protein ACIG56_14095 [Nocardia fusca]